MNIARHIHSLHAFVAAIGTLVSLFVITAQAHAATLVVTNSSGAGTLSQAITDANPGDTITFAPNVSGTINLFGTTFFTKPLTIQGPGAQVLTVSSSGPSGIFSLGFGASNQTIRFSGLTLSGGFAFVGGNGAAFSIFGANNTLALTDMVLANNASAGSVNTSGAVFVTAGNTAVISATTIASNTSPQPGVAVLNQGNLVVINSTLSNNRDNFTPTNTNASSIRNSGTMTLTNVTFFSNTTHINSSAPATLTNVLLGNPGAGGNCAGTGYVSLGGNISSDASCTAFTQPTDISNTNPLAGPLQNNGGGTPTHALLVGSPAVDAAVVANCPTTDQRGVARPQGAACDIGAFEFVSVTQTIAFAPLANRPITDPPFGITATASSGLTVTFASLTPATCSISDTSVTLIAVGACTLRASQVGDRFYQAAPNVDQSFVIQALTQTITFDPLPDRLITDPPFAVTATASSGLPVVFTSLTPGVCTSAGNTVMLVAAGQCAIRASQAGDAIYAAAADVDRTFNVQKLSQTITFAALPDRTIGSPSFTLTATASSGLSVTFSSTTPAICSTTGSMVTFNAAGTCTLRASQVGDATYAPAPDVDRSFVINLWRVQLPLLRKD
jgi:hypothetical protein